MADPIDGSAASVTDTQTKTEVVADFDPSKLTDDQFSKIYEDQRLYNHPRFKQLGDRAKKATEYEEATKRAEEEKLKVQGEYKTLAEQKEAEAKSLKEQLTQYKTDNKIIAEAQKLGVHDVDAVLKLVDRSKIAFDDSGEVKGVTETLASLLAEKPYLKAAKAAATLGGGTNPANANTVTRHKLSDIQNAAYYQKHEADILKAYSEGRIDNDLPR